MLFSKFFASDDSDDGSGLFQFVLVELMALVSLRVTDFPSKIRRGIQKGSQRHLTFRLRTLLLHPKTVTRYGSPRCGLAGTGCFVGSEYIDRTAGAPRGVWPSLPVDLGSGAARHGLRQGRRVFFFFFFYFFFGRPEWMDVATWNGAEGWKHQTV